jgi:hypothetical protein
VDLIDLGFVLAVIAFGWGLSLATYRRVAARRGWPMGSWQTHRPRLTMLVAVTGVLVAVFYALARGYGGYVLSAALIPAFGLAWAAFWTGFFRVGAQSALLLAPIAAIMLLVRWLG